jgi:Lantibiotic biosynthesis dehydratase C-term
VSEQWVQLNVSLVRDEEGQGLASALAMFDALTPFLSRARDEGFLRSFYFMRKPPDVCLRLEGPEPKTHLLPGAIAVLREQCRQGAIAGWYESVYEPETRKFGGAVAMDAVHGHFDVDTDVWLNVQGLQRSVDDNVAVAPSAVMEAMANDLFVRALRDRDEVWDTWCNMAMLANPDAPEDGCGAGAAAPPGPVVRATFIDDLVQAGPPALALVLGKYLSANQVLADALRAEPAAGQPPGLRATLAFVAQYDFHRWGLAGPAQAAVAASMMAAWHPARRLRGAL